MASPFKKNKAKTFSSKESLDIKQVEVQKTSYGQLQVK